MKSSIQLHAILLRLLNIIVPYKMNLLDRSIDADRLSIYLIKGSSLHRNVIIQVGVAVIVIRAFRTFVVK